MADKILHKRSGTPSAVPSAASLELGELALNTADGRAFMKKNDGAVVEIGSNASGYFRTEPITATATGQTSFTVPGGYTPGAIFVSLNGATLPPADFTATDGTTVVLASGEGVVAGSVLLVHVLSAFDVADALPLGGTAADSSKLGGQAPSYYATQDEQAAIGSRVSILEGQPGIGWNQTWQNVTSSRAINTHYINTSGKPIMVSAFIGAVTSTVGAINLTVDGVLIRGNYAPTGGYSVCTVMIPPGSSYIASIVGTNNNVFAWVELR